MVTGQHILVVDDDPEIRRLVGGYLEKHGFRISVVADGRGFREAMRRLALDLIILDLNLPGEDGLNLCKFLRGFSNMPIIILSARSQEDDRITGLELGADDYLAKPFNTRELLARVRSVLRRSKTFNDYLRDPDREVTLSFGDWIFEVATRKLRATTGEAVPLSGGEYTMLLAFLNNPNRVLSRDTLLDLTRGGDSEVFDRTIDMQISRLRKQLGDQPHQPTYIKTIRNNGYIFCADVKLM